LIVVDASVLTDFLLGRPRIVSAIDEKLADRRHEPMHAPELLEPEALNAVRRLVRHRHVTAQRAAEAITDLANLRLVRYPHAPLRPRVWALRDSLTAYDASYLALAEALEDAVLMTGDSGLARTARRSLGASGVDHVG
jgi:predicted nucleic acid-binding protein